LQRQFENHFQADEIDQLAREKQFVQRKSKLCCLAGYFVEILKKADLKLCFINLSDYTMFLTGKLRHFSPSRD